MADVEDLGEGRLSSVERPTAKVESYHAQPVHFFDGDLSKV